MSLTLKSKISLLKKLDFMSGQKEDVFHFLANLENEVSFSEGEIIFKKGDKGGAAYVIAKGCVQIHDQEHVFIELEKGKSFGEFALIDTDSRSASATAKQNSILLQCTQDQLRLVEQEFQIKIIDVIQTALQNMKQRMLVKDLLEEELTRQKIQIEEQKKELETLNATKDKFFSIIAHDLKNPFASLIGASGYLLSSSNELSQEQMTNFLTIINNSAKQGHRLLENLLEWSRMQTGMMSWQPEQVDLWDLVNEVVSLLRGSAETKQIHLEAKVDENLSAFVDSNMINTVVRNLVSNAIKFTPNGGEIIVESRQSKNFVEITVKDNGVGIKAENIEKLFKIDEQVMQNGTENETGTGLGLILCKEFIDKHKGELLVKSEINKGSSFIFRLPMV
ncbi:ATP-binding protein [Ancylomarina sp. DW003]|nr:ATP-binding protein [Ancylomarina sp. DW003]MDE5421641.1 ATP-binding protein [Ancylomarina sp. DW003]